MNIGIPQEIKNNENRVSMTPSGVAILVKNGHTVRVQAGAGINSGFTDEQYVQAGAQILPTIEDVYSSSEMIVKVKEPIEREYSLIRSKQVLFTYMHFAASELLTKAMINSGAICIAYETVQKADRSLPLLTPMSEVAGRTSVQAGVHFLQSFHGGKGILLGGVPGVKPAKVLILGGGTVGASAAKIAAGMGAHVVICDISVQRLSYLADIMPANVTTLLASEYNIRQELKDTDLVIGAVLVSGSKTPHLLTRDMLKLLEPGSVVVDVAIDQGGCFDSSRQSSHSEPVFNVCVVIHYCVGYFPGAMPRTSTLALTNSTLPYVVQLADKGWKKACRENLELEKGLNIVEGKVVYPGVAAAWNLPLSKVALD